MESRTFQLLEFPKILKALSGLAVSKPGQLAALKVRPLPGLEELRAQSDLLTEVSAWSGESGFALRDFPALDGLFAFLAAERNILDLDSLWAIWETLVVARDARDGVASAPTERFPRLTGLMARAAWPDRTWSGLKRCLANDGTLRDESSPELFSVRQDIRAIHQKCTKKVRDFVQTEGIAQYLQDEFMTVSSDRYVLPLKTNFKGRVQGIIHDYSQTGETCYFEPYFLVDVNNELQELKQQEREEEHRVLIFLSGLIRSELDLVRGFYDLLVDLDLLLAKRALAAALDGRLLPVSPEAPLSLRRVRHPLLVLNRDRIQPVDIELLDGQRVLVISGGNAGGKTVCLKALGLVALMALSALPVPVDEGSSLPSLENIFVFLGDEQSLEEHVSTFTGQIQHLSRVWDDIDERSLVLLDEFGAGTDPTQGAALAQAVVDGLLDKRALAAAATHFPALKAYGLSKEGVRAASVLFDPQTKKPLYRLAYDQVGASLAIDVARENGLPEDILSRAESYLLIEGGDTSKVIDRLNELAVQREEENAALGRERLDLQRKKARLVEQFEREQRALLAEIKTLSQSVLREWQAGKLGRKEALRELSKARQQLAGESSVQSEDAAKPVLNFASIDLGQKLRYLPWDKTATVLDKDEKRCLVKVDMGGVTIWVKLDELNLEAGGRVATTGGFVARTGARQTSMTLDLRGYRVEDVAGELARFLDAAILSGLDQVEIIHGRGTGALRREVHAWLKEYPAVARFSLAPEDKGGDGLTVVELR